MSGAFLPLIQLFTCFLLFFTVFSSSLGVVSAARPLLTYKRIISPTFTSPVLPRLSRTISSDTKPLIPGFSRQQELEMSRRHLFEQIPRAIFPRDKGLIPAVIISCGSFSPATKGHLYMLSWAQQFVRNRLENHHLLASIISPASDKYAKSSKLIAGEHRSRLLQLSIEDALQDADLLAPHSLDEDTFVDTWESEQISWLPTYKVLDSIRERVTAKLGLAPKIYMLAGADLIESFKTIKADGSRLWPDSDLMPIFEQCGLLIIDRKGYDALETLQNHIFASLPHYEIHRIGAAFENTLSSTEVRNNIHLLKDGGLQHLLTPSAAQYILDHHLYQANTPVDK